MKYDVNTSISGNSIALFTIGEPETAVYLSALLITIVFILILLERRNRKNIKVADNNDNSGRLSKIKPDKRYVRFILFLVVFIPVLLGFVFPVVQLIYWA